ncbi:hypothetical protein DL96DRAFT_1612773 [Flagelloscypha sp. PMI_526]|nr:hypothetical protein DL96DRAFT_1612773 [Flagelloscypha sp. PMI_526]
MVFTMFDRLIPIVWLFCFEVALQISNSFGGSPNLCASRNAWSLLAAMNILPSRDAAIITRRKTTMGRKMLSEVLILEDTSRTDVFVGWTLWGMVVWVVVAGIILTVYVWRYDHVSIL